MAVGKTVFHGEPIAVLLAQNRYALEDAAELVHVHYETLPVVVDPSHAAGRSDLVLPLARAAVAAGADGVMVDGTFFTDGEMPALGLSPKRARQIGHLPQSGPGGMIEWMAKLPAHTRRLLIHINNSNPILDEDSDARATLNRERIEVCEDRMNLHF